MPNQSQAREWQEVSAYLRLRDTEQLNYSEGGMLLLAEITLPELLGMLDRIGMAGLALIGLWFVWNRLNSTIDAKDKRIAELETAYAKQADDHALEIRELNKAHVAKIEQLQAVTIQKIEQWGDKTGVLVEKCMELQVEINTALKQLSIVK